MKFDCHKKFQALFSLAEKLSKVIRHSSNKSIIKMYRFKKVKKGRLRSCDASDVEGVHGPR